MAKFIELSARQYSRLMRAIRKPGEGDIDVSTPEGAGALIRELEELSRKYSWYRDRCKLFMEELVNFEGRGGNPKNKPWKG